MPCKAIWEYTLSVTVPNLEGQYHLCEHAPKIHTKHQLLKRVSMMPRDSCSVFLKVCRY